MSVDKKYVLMSIKPKYASLIRSGEKTVELRRRIPKIQSGDIVVVYESSPVKRISMYFTVDSVVKTSPSDLWHLVSNNCKLSKEAYDIYFSNTNTAYGIRISGVTSLSAGIPLSVLESVARAPQNCSYIQACDFERVLRCTTVSSEGQSADDKTKM